MCKERENLKKEREELFGQERKEDIQIMCDAHQIEFPFDLLWASQVEASESKILFEISEDRFNGCWPSH